MHDFKDTAQADCKRGSEDSVGRGCGSGQFAAGKLWGLAGPLGRQPCLVDLVEQSPIADVQDLGGFAAVPVVCLQRAKNQTLFHRANRLLSDALQRDGTVLTDLKRRCEGLALQRLRSRGFNGSEQNIAGHAVFELSDVSGPIPLLEELYNGPGKGRRGAPEFLIEALEEEIQHERKD